MATVTDPVMTKVEAFQLAAEIQVLLEGCEVNAGLSALNYVMATMLHDHFGATEEVLAKSDEQTRFVASILASERVTH
jgi:hypothetical protein